MTEPDLPQHPIDLFETVFKLAREKSQFDPTAMVLSTSTRTGRPSSRVVLLKSVTKAGFTFFTNYLSRKSRELEENPQAALCFYWPVIDQQVRIEGTVDLATAAVSDAYFASRPRISQLGAWASEQSNPLESRQVLMDRLTALEDEYKDQPVPRPPNWGGYVLRPDAIEFWYNGEFRLHDRFLYTRIAGSDDWKVERLNP